MKNTCLFILFILIFSNISNGRSEDWPRWRGINSNGVSGETNWNSKALTADVHIQWQTNVGMGHSAVAIRGNKLYTMGNRQLDDENYIDIVFCLDSKTGKEIWQYPYPCKEGEDPGPGSTPVLEGSNLYTLSREGHLHCFNSDNGNVRWRRHIVSEGLADTHDWGFSSSPVISGDILILNINQSGIAFDKNTGELIWNSKKDKCGFGTPVLFKQNGKNLATVINDRKLRAFDIQTGQIQWTHNAGWGDADPIIWENHIVMTGQFTILLDLNKSNPEEVWKNKDISWQFQSGGIHNNQLYGFGKIDWDRRRQAFYSVALQSGKLNWEHEFEMWGASTVSGNRVILITGQGRLIIIEASPEAYKEISSAQVIQMAASDTSRDYRRECQCWTYPVISDGYIYVRNTFGELVCVDVR